LSRQATYPLRKGFWLDGFLGFQRRSVVIALADGLCDLGGKSLQLKASVIWGRRAVPLLNYTLAFALELRKSTENLSQGRPVVAVQYGRHIYTLLSLSLTNLFITALGFIDD
jgi:hypothetical protein